MNYKFPKIEAISEKDCHYKNYYANDLIGKAVFKIKEVGPPDEDGFYFLDCYTKKLGHLIFHKVKLSYIPEKFKK